MHGLSPHLVSVQEWKTLWDAQHLPAVGTLVPSPPVSSPAEHTAQVAGPPMHSVSQLLAPEPAPVGMGRGALCSEVREGQLSGKWLCSAICPHPLEGACLQGHQDPDSKVTAQ